MKGPLYPVISSTGLRRTTSEGEQRAEWAQRWHGEINYQLTQFLSGHGGWWRCRSSGWFSLLPWMWLHTWRPAEYYVLPSTILLWEPDPRRLFDNHNKPSEHRRGNVEVGGKLVSCANKRSAEGLAGSTGKEEGENGGGLVSEKPTHYCNLARQCISKIAT